MPIYDIAFDLEPIKTTVAYDGQGQDVVTVAEAMASVLGVEVKLVRVYERNGKARRRRISTDNWRAA